MASSYNKIDTAEPSHGLGPTTVQLGASRPPKKKKKLIFLGIAVMASLLVCGVAVSLYVRTRVTHSRRRPSIQPSQAVVLACGQTRYPSLCLKSLTGFPGSHAAAKSDLVRISVNLTLRHVGQAVSGLTGLAGVSMTRIARRAVKDCLELLQDSMDQLSKSMAAAASGGGNTADVMTWLSAALTNQDTCKEGMGQGTEGVVRDRVAAQLENLEEIISNCLAIYAMASGARDYEGIPVKNRRLLEAAPGSFPLEEDGFPAWLTARDRRLLTMEMKDVQADIVVAADGSGTYRTITEAIKAVPEQSTKRTVIYVKAGRYQEYLKVARKKWNVMIMGDGKGITVISGARTIQEGYTTFHTATFAATGAGFIARDITFENSADPSKHQAVALRIGADHAVIYRCSIISYQDTLYVHSQRQFYRECDIYGTVDFIFGNAAVVIQKSNIIARKPMANQKNTITAQNRKDPNQNTGMSIHDCQILAAQDLEPVKNSVPTYLGRPWKLYSRVVYMLSYMGDHIEPSGWLPWMGSFALDTLYYGEYMNYGPGAATGKRVQWPGYRVITSAEEAGKFTVAEFIYGTSWLPYTGVAFVGGLS
ncbi:putative pectinesterase/pectinesterase inhibitor 34 [Nymphaea thermarum]|nr:putative pectinesterase/pectinesterase inhibitor 34 [Nymphaea thermarum]